MDIMLPQNFWSFDVAFASDADLEQRRINLDELGNVIEVGDMHYPALGMSRYNVACMQAFRSINAKNAPVRPFIRTNRGGKEGEDAN